MEKQWPTFDWEKSVIQPVTFEGREYLIKRDDLITPIGGNKARKLEGLLQRDRSSVEEIISHGGSQSNSMLALAQLANIAGLRFTYFTRPVPRWLRDSPIGNLAQALELGMRWEITEKGQPPSALREPIPESKRWFIPQGISMPEAEAGIKRLSTEILNLRNAIGINLSIIIPSGTGTTALFLQRHLPFPVYAIPCIGDAKTLQAWFTQFEPDTSFHPIIIEGPSGYHFGQPHLDLWNIHQELREQTGIEFELLYDSKAWLTRDQWPTEGAILYLHCGGTRGNESMVRRYQRRQPEQ